MNRMLGGRLSWYVFGVGLMTMTGAVAEAPTRRAQREIQAVYQKQSQALAKKDYSVLERTRTRNYVFIDEKGHKSTHSQLRATYAYIFATTHSVRFVATIETVIPRKHCTCVVVSQQAAFTFIHPKTKRRYTRRASIRTNDRWIKAKNQWLMRESRSLDTVPGQQSA